MFGGLLGAWPRGWIMFGGLLGVCSARGRLRGVWADAWLDNVGACLPRAWLMFGIFGGFSLLGAWLDNVWRLFN